MKLHDLPDREVRIALTKMFTEVKKTMHKQNYDFSKETKNMKRYQAEITGSKTTLLYLTSRNYKKNKLSPKLAEGTK
jgi:hypothetical protein